MLNRRKKTDAETSATAHPPTPGSTTAGAAAPPDAATPGAPRDRAQGKGAPTPRRRDQVAARRRPFVPEDRKAARQAQRAAAAAERARQRQALETGDERHLPARDRGLQRRFVRDLVDARTGFGEWLMPVVLLYVLFLFVPSPRFLLMLMVILYVIVAGVLIESFWLAARIRRRVVEKFGAPEPGIRFYGVMRALQFRRLRLPKPQVRRGQAVA